MLKSIIENRRGKTITFNLCKECCVFAAKQYHTSHYQTKTEKDFCHVIRYSHYQKTDENQKKICFLRLLDFLCCLCRAQYVRNFQMSTQKKRLAQVQPFMANLYNQQIRKRWSAITNSYDVQNGSLNRHEEYIGEI